MRPRARLSAEICARVKDRLTVKLGARFDKSVGWYAAQASPAGTWVPARSTEGDSKSFRAPVGLYSELAVLAGDVMTADVLPTNPMKEAQELLNKNGAVSAGTFDAVMNKEMAAFNALLKAKNSQPINPQQQ